MNPAGSRGALFCPNDGLPLLRTDAAARCVDDALAGTVLDERYAIFEPTSSGDLPGQAYHALQLPEGSQVLVHVALPDEFGGAVDPRRFFASAPRYQRLRAPGVLPLLDHGAVPDGGVYLVTAPAAGPTLRKVLSKASRPPGWPGALAVTAELLAGLEVAHAQGVIHGALHPGRLVLRGGQRCRLVAVGLGFNELLKPAGDERRTRQPSKFQLDARTATYLSPEQIEELSPDPRSDVYALGCLLYRLIVGRPPYGGRGALQILSAHLAGRFPADKLSEAAGGRVAEVLGRACARGPSGRQATAGVLLAELQAAADGRSERCGWGAFGLSGADELGEAAEGPLQGSPLPAPAPGGAPRYTATAPTSPAAVTPTPPTAPTPTTPELDSEPDTLMMPSLPEALAAADPTRPMPPMAEQLAAVVAAARADAANSPALLGELGDELEPDTVRVSPDAVYLARAIVAAPHAGSALPMGELETQQLGGEELDQARAIVAAMERGEDPTLSCGPGEEDDEDATFLMPALRSQPAAEAAASPPVPAPAATTAPAAPPAASDGHTGASGDDPSTMHLPALDPGLVQLQAEYARKQAAADQEKETERRRDEAAARRRKRTQALLLVAALAVGSLAGGAGLWIVRGARRSADEAVQLEEQIEAFLAGLEQTEEEAPTPQDPVLLRAHTRAQVLRLVDQTWAAVQESERQIDRVRPLLDAGVAGREGDALATELAGLAKEVRTIRREAIELKLALPEASDEALPGVAANERRLRTNLLEVRASARAAVDDLSERFGRQLSSALARQTAAARRPRPAGRRADAAPPPKPAGGANAQPAGATVAAVRAATGRSGAASAGPAESDEELLSRVLGPQRRGPIEVPGQSCPCPPDTLQASVRAGPRGADVPSCELAACWKLSPGHPRFSEVALGLSRYHFFRKDHRKQFLALRQATRYGRYGHDPSTLFSLIAVATRVGNFKVAIEAKDRFLYLKHLLPAAERERKVPEAFRILGQAFEHRYYRAMERDPESADPALLNRAIDYLERYVDYAGQDTEMKTKLDELRRLRQEAAAP